MCRAVGLYLSIIQHSHGAKLSTSDVHYHFVLQAAADPSRCGLIGRGPRSHLSRVIVAPSVHLDTDNEFIMAAREGQTGV